MDKERQTPQNTEALWRVWIDTRRRVVSFHEQENACLLEFHSQDMFWNYVNQYAGMEYRYQ